MIKLTIMLEITLIPLIVNTINKLRNVLFKNTVLLIQFIEENYSNTV